MLIDFVKKGLLDSRDPAPPVQRQIGEDDFRRWLSDNYRVALLRYQSGDIQGTMRILERYHAMLEIADEDPLLSLLESGTVGIILILASNQISNFRFARGFELIQMAVDILDAKFARYQKYGDRPPPDSLFWCAIAGVLGSAKWIAPDEYRDAVLTIYQMVYRYYKAESTLRRNLLFFSKSEEQKRNIFHNFKNHALGVIRAVMRHDPERVDEVQNRVEEFHGPEYFSESKPYIYALAYAEEYLKPDPDLARIEKLQQKYVTMAVESRPEFPNDAFIKSAQKELDYLTRSRQHPLQLLDG